MHVCILMYGMVCVCIKNLWDIEPTSTNKYMSTNASHIRRVSYSDVLLIKGLNKTERHVGLCFYLPMLYAVRVMRVLDFTTLICKMEFGFSFLRFQNVDRLSIPTKSEQ